MVAFSQIVFIGGPVCCFETVSTAAVGSSCSEVRGHKGLVVAALRIDSLRFGSWTTLGVAEVDMVASGRCP